MGEGFRNTTELRGRAGVGHGRVHWSGNFDEIHDFEGQIRLLGKGTGLLADADFNAGTRSESLGDPKNGLSSDLDALSAYVTSLDSFAPSPHRNPDGSLTPAAVAGKAHFDALNCASCHGGAAFTDSSLGALHNVGTLTPNSGSRLGQLLTGIDTPTLRGIWDTAPYLHDGSAPTLRDVLTTRNPLDQHGAISGLSSPQIDELVAYLQQIDSLEPDAAPAIGVDSLTFTSYIASYGLTGSPLADTGDDFDKDGFDNLTEMLLGATDPTDASATPSIQPSTHQNADNQFYQLSWLHRDGGTWDGLSYHWGGHSYTPEGALDLNNWTTGLSMVPNPAGLPAAPADYQWVTARFNATMNTAPTGFIRLRLDE
jgi:hypothetical protein